MFSCPIVPAEFRRQPDGKVWVVQPGGGAILAYCDTIIEAERFMVGLKDLAQCVANGWAFRKDPTPR